MEKVLIILGTYSGGLLGYQLKENPSDGGFFLNTEFAYAAHVSAITCMATAGNYLFTGSSDEAIKLFRLDTRREDASLIQHSASVTLLDTVTDPETGAVLNLVSGDEEGHLFGWRAKRWECLGELKGHRGRIVSGAFHPEGKVLLTVSAGPVEQKLRLWDVVRGTCAVAEDLSEEPTLLRWNKAGNLYFILTRNQLEIRHASLPLKKAFLRKEEKGTALRFTAAVFLDNDILVTGDSSGQVQCYSVTGAIDGDVVATHITSKTFSKNRVKALGASGSSSVAASDSEGYLAILRVHKRANGTTELIKICDVQSNARVTSMCVNGQISTS